MNVIYTYRHTESSKALEARMDGHLDKMVKLMPPAVDVHCIFSVEGYRNIVEINLRGSHLDVSAHDSKDDMYKAIDTAAAKLERQVRKHKEKITSHN